MTQPEQAGSFEFVVTAHGGTASDPYLVATRGSQLPQMVDDALRDPGLTGVAARTHHRALFYVAERPVGIGDHPTPSRFLQVGFFAGFAGALFYDDPRRPGDTTSTVPVDTDWAWLAYRAKPIADAPQVYSDQPTGTVFPARAVMTMQEVRTLALQWCTTAQRPTDARWVAVNDLRWKLDSAGELTGR